jgi:hypothetical protein
MNNSLYEDNNPKEKYFLTITQVNCFTNYDENTIPELDKFLIGE